MTTPLAAENRENELRLGAKARRVFTPKGWNDAVRMAGIAAGNWWIANYGPLRWNKGYALSKLGYDPGPRKRKRMARGEAPYFSTGDFMAGFNSRARTEAVAKKGRVQFWIVTPSGRLNFRPQHVKTWKRIPPSESAAVAREYRRGLIQAVMAGRVAHAQRQKAKAEAKLAKKQANAARRAITRANRSQRRRAALNITA